MTYEEVIQIINTEYTDSFGLITQKNGDPGDSASRVGIYHYLRSLNEGCTPAISLSLNHMLTEIEIQPGIYIRHPYQPQFINETYIADPKQFSRDQTVPLILAMGQFDNEVMRLKSLSHAQSSRPFFKFQNGDLLGPMEGNAYIRATNSKWMYPFLCIFDIGLVVNASIRVVKRFFNPNDTSDDVVMGLLIIQAYNRLSTPLSWLARQIYKLARPQNALDSYFSPESGASPLNELYRPQFQKMGL